MINLLPPDVKERYHYARRNSRMVGWVIACSFAIAGLAGLSIGGLIYLNQTAKSYDRQATLLEAALKDQDQAGTRAKVTAIRNDLKLAVDVLSKQVLYSQLLRQLATLIPGNAALAGLTISQDQTTLDITANTADYTAATQLQVNLADTKNKLFTQADIVSINCTAGSSGGSTSTQRYPCTVTIRALFVSKNPFLFINSGKAGQS